MTIEIEDDIAEEISKQYLEEYYENQLERLRGFLSGEEESMVAYSYNDDEEIFGYVEELKALECVIGILGGSKVKLRKLLEETNDELYYGFSSMKEMTEAYQDEVVKRKEVERELTDLREKVSNILN